MTSGNTLGNVESLFIHVHPPEVKLSNQKSNSTGRQQIARCLVAAVSGWSWVSEGGFEQTGSSTVRELRSVTCF